MEREIWSLFIGTVHSTFIGRMRYGDIQRKGEKVRFKLPEAAFRKLCRLVKQRDEELAETYQSIIGEWPPSRGEVHHAKHAGSGGPDKEDNLIHLSYETHRFKAHGLSGTRKQYMDEQIKTYLNCHAVKEWRKEHEMELQELYKTEEERRIKKKRAGCIPKKPKWAKY